MHPIIRNILAVVLGCLIGGLVNMSLINVGGQLFPIEGVDPTNMDDLARVMPTLAPQYFIFPFLAHAVGTLVGAVIASSIASQHKMRFALGIGLFFLVGGIAACFMIPAPTWFVFTDLLLAYIPMAWIGGKLAAVIAKS